MAGNVNKPKGGGRTDRSGLGQVFRKVAQAAKPGVEETKLQAVHEALNARMEKLIEKKENVERTAEEFDDLLKDIAVISGPLSAVQAKLEVFEAGRQTSVQKVIQQQIGRFAGERTSAARMRNIGQQAGTYGQASTIASQVPGSVLQQRHEHSINRAQAARQSLIERATEGAPQEELERIAGIMTTYEQRGAVTGSALAAQRRRGESTQQLHEQGLKLTSAITQQKRKEHIEAEAVARVSPNDPRHISQGGFSGTEQERLKALNAAAENLAKTFEDFNKALSDGSAELGKTETAYKQAQETFRNAQIAAGAGSGGLFNMGNIPIGAKLQLAGAAIGAVGTLSKTFGVQIPMQEKAVQTGFANLANRQYTDARSAIENYDMAAARRLGHYNRASDFGDARYRYTQTGAVLESAGNLVSNLGGGGASGKDGGGGGGKISNIFDSGVNIIGDIGAWWSGIPGGEKSLAAQELELSLEDAKQFVKDANKQDFVNFTKSVGDATRGLGGRNRELVLGGYDIGNGLKQGGLFDQGSIEKLAAVGINPNEIAGLTRGANTALGGAFTGFRDLQRAGAAQRAGTLTAEQYIGQAGALTGVGGGSDQLEKIMRQAVSAGMDNSKNIHQLVGATVSLSSNLAAQGMDVSRGASDILSAQIQGMGHIPVNQRVSVAQRANEWLSNAATSTDTNLWTVQRMARVRDQFPNLNMNQLQLAATVDPKTIRAIRSQMEKDPNKAYEIAEKAGLGRILSDDGRTINLDKLRAQEGITRGTLMSEIRGFGMVGKEATAAAKAHEEGLSFKEFKEKDPAAYAGFLEAARVKGQDASALWDGLGALSDKKIKENNTNKIGGVSEEVEDMSRIQAEGAAKPIVAGMQALGNNFKESLTKTNKILEELKDKFEPTKMEGAAAKAAEDFKAPIGVFDKATKQFELAVVKLETALVSFEKTSGLDLDRLSEIRKNNAKGNPTYR